MVFKFILQANWEGRYSTRGREVRGLGISMSCLSCVFLCTVVGKICSVISAQLGHVHTLLELRP